ncbi:MAG TPA: MBL fold metallo-hydrolase [Candidatus Eisenbacteria bacterium]
MSTAPGPWSDLGGGVQVRQSVAFGMNSTLLLHPEHAVVVDPGVLPSELDDLARAVREADPARVTLFFTHAHWDHVLGRPWWPDAETLAHDHFTSSVRAQRDHVLDQARKQAEAHGEAWNQGFEAFRLDHAVSGLHLLKLGPWRLVLRDAPGHHDTQLTAHLPEQRLLIAADMLSDREPPLLARPCSVYRRTLQELWPLAEHGAIDTLVPGHGSVARGRDEVVARLRRDLAYLERLEAAVRAALREGLSLEQTEERLGAPDGPLRRAEPGTSDDHANNVAEEYRAAAASPRRRVPG